jgi:hypothetical protein
VVDDKPDTSMDNLQFAREFSKVKNGSSLSVTPPADRKGQQQNRGRTGKPEKPGVPQTRVSVSTSASSTTGGDADDDMSPIDSPKRTGIPMTGDVSDMLEAPALPASTLRITGTAETPSTNKQKHDNFKPAETKKQRQQRLKREENKARVKEAEQQRKVLLEKQLHTAREHERQEARKSKPAAPAANPWTKAPLADKTNGAQPQTQKPSGAPAAAGLLDTFEPHSQPSSSNQPKQSGKPTEKNWANNLPSEEEQMRILNAMSSENDWTTVSSKKKEKKRDAKSGADTVSEASSSGIPPSKPATIQEQQQQKPAAYTSPPGPITTEQRHPLDSDWPA